MFSSELIKKSKELGLYNSNSPKEKSRLLKIIYPYIKKAKEEGASYNTILEKVNESFKIQYTLPAFIKALKRIEKENEYTTTLEKEEKETLPFPPLLTTFLL
jgi:hypothetical protein